MVQPYLLYCNVVWGGASQLALNRLIILQKRAVRLINHSQFSAPTSLIFKDLHILRLEDLHSLQLALFVYKVLNNLVPQSCLHHVSNAVHPHRYALRRESQLCITPFHSNIREKYIGVCGPKFWNSLPEIVTAPACSFAAFKRRLFDFLIG